MITTIKDLKDFKLETNLKIAELNSNELSRNWIKSNHKTTTIESSSNFILKENEILVKVMQNLYVVLPLSTEKDYIKMFKLNIIFGKSKPCNYHASSEETSRYGEV